MGTATDLITWAASQIGTKESPAGSNIVRYWDYYKERCGADYQGQPWCAAFVANGMSVNGLWEFTRDEGRFRYCPSLVNWAKENGCWLDRKEVCRSGDLVVFANNTRACHVGFVEKRIDASKVQTIEGNTSVTSNDNGGAVMRRQRGYGTVGSSWYILGFVRPSFGPTSLPGQPAKTPAQAAMEIWQGKGGWGDDPERSERLRAAGIDPEAVRDEIRMLAGNAGGKEGDVYEFPLVKYGSKGDSVSMCQAALNIRSAAGLAVDGDAGSKTKQAIADYQSKVGLDPDGECGRLTWPKLLAD